MATIIGSRAEVQCMESARWEEERGTDEAVSPVAWLLQQDRMQRGLEPLAHFGRRGALQCARGRLTRADHQYQPIAGERREAKRQRDQASEWDTDLGAWRAAPTPTQRPVDRTVQPDTAFEDQEASAQLTKLARMYLGDEAVAALLDGASVNTAATSSGVSVRTLWLKLARLRERLTVTSIVAG